MHNEVLVIWFPWQRQLDLHRQPQLLTEKQKEILPLITVGLLHCATTSIIDNALYCRHRRERVSLIVVKIRADSMLLNFSFTIKTRSYCTITNQIKALRTLHCGRDWLLILRHLSKFAVIRLESELWEWNENKENDHAEKYYGLCNPFASSSSCYMKEGRSQYRHVTLLMHFWSTF